MIVDTSALVAVLRVERGWDAIQAALLVGGGLIPAPVRVEFTRVISAAENHPHPGAEPLLELVHRRNLTGPFTSEDAAFAAAANPLYGTGNGQGGTLNLLDLMVYGMAKRTGRSILCTGRDFAATDAEIHPASRLG